MTDPARRPIPGRAPVARRAGAGRPRSWRSEEAILEATGKLLSSEGYLGLTVSKVAARARASKSTIYRRWPTKEHLVIAGVRSLAGHGSARQGKPAVRSR